MWFEKFSVRYAITLKKRTPLTKILDPPLYSAELRGSGLFKALRMMIGHSILQDGIGFPHLSPLCIAEGEQRALEYVTLADVGAQTAAAVTRVGKSHFDKWC